MEYENNHKITFTKRITGATETQVFICPYGFNVRFRLLKLMAYNEAGSATNVKILDHIVTNAPTDPPAQGDSTNPLTTIGVATVDHENLPADVCPEIIFQQGMSVIPSQANIIVTAVVEEA